MKKSKKQWEQEFNAPVEIVKIEEKFGIPAVGSRKNAVIITEDGKEGYINNVSDSYQLLPNKEAFGVIDKVLKGMGLKTEVEYRRVDHRYYKTWIFPEHKIDLNGTGKGGKHYDMDVLFPRVTSWNSYDASLAFGYDCGLYRQICSNGLIVPYHVSKEYFKKQIHTPQVLEVQKQIEENITAFLDEFKTLFEPLLKLNDKKVKDVKDRIEEVLSATGIIKVPKAIELDVTEKKAKEKEDEKPVKDNRWTLKVLERVEDEMKKLGRKDASDFLILNAINYALADREFVKKSDGDIVALNQKTMAYMMN
jgi:hypothetical protein